MNNILNARAGVFFRTKDSCDTQSFRALVLFYSTFIIKSFILLNLYSCHLERR